MEDGNCFKKEVQFKEHNDITKNGKENELHFGMHIYTIKYFISVNHRKISKLSRIYFLNVMLVFKCTIRETYAHHINFSQIEPEILFL